MTKGSNFAVFEKVSGDAPTNWCLGTSVLSVSSPASLCNNQKCFLFLVINLEFTHRVPKIRFTTGDMLLQSFLLCHLATKIYNSSQWHSKRFLEDALAHRYRLDEAQSRTLALTSALLHIQRPLPFGPVPDARLSCLLFGIGCIERY